MHIVIGALSTDSNQTEAELVFEQIRSIIDQLFSLALQIRSPATRKIPAIHKVDLFKNVTPEFKPEFIKMVEEREYNGLAQIFQQCRREVQCQGKEDIGQTKPLKEGDKQLIRRLLQANHVRRCRFQYWKRYKTKSVQFTARVTGRNETPSLIHTTYSRQIGQSLLHPSNLSHQPSSRLSSQLPILPDFQLPGPTSSKSSRSAGVTVKGEDGLMVTWPLPPSHARKAPTFECPYCFFMCSARTARQDRWRYQAPRLSFQEVS